MAARFSDGCISGAPGLCLRRAFRREKAVHLRFLTAKTASQTEAYSVRHGGKTDEGPTEKTRRHLVTSLFGDFM